MPRRIESHYPQPDPGKEENPQPENLSATVLLGLRLIMEALKKPQPLPKTEVQRGPVTTTEPDEFKKSNI